MKKSDLQFIIFFDITSVKLYSLNGKTLKRIPFKINRNEKADRLFYSYEYDSELDKLVFYPLTNTKKNFCIDRTYYGNVININLIWREFLMEISQYIPKMGKLCFVIGRIDDIGIIESESLEDRFILLEDCKTIFKNRVVSMPNFGQSVFTFLLSLNDRYKKNVILFANTFYMIVGNGKISVLYYDTDGIVEDYSKSLNISDLFYGKYEITQIVNRLLMEYFNFNEVQYETTRQNQTITIDSNIIKEAYDKMLARFVHNVRNFPVNQALYVIDVTSRNNRLVSDFNRILETSPYIYHQVRYPDFIEDSLIYAFLVTSRNKSIDQKRALAIFKSSERGRSRSYHSTDGLYLYDLHYFMNQKSANSLIGEYIKKIKFEKQVD